MDHFPIRQAIEFGKFISTAGKGMLNLVKLPEVLLKNVGNCGKYCPVNFVYFSITQGKVIHCMEMAITFAVRNTKVYTKFANFTGLYFPHSYFSSKLHNFTQFRMLFPAMLINFC